MRIFLTAFFLMLALGTVIAQISPPIAGQIIVRLQPGSRTEKLMTQLNARRSGAIIVKATRPLGTAHNIHLLTFNPEKINSHEVLESLQAVPEVIAAQWNYEVAPRQTPDDPEYEKQWGLERIGVPGVWDYATGGLSANGDTIVVAILDFGFDVNHVDLQNNIWHNRAEIPNDDIDNDQNGYLDDIAGWNFVNDSNQHLQDSHGTSVAGIIGADGNNKVGVAGINWSVKLMPFTVSTVADIIAAYEYCIEQRRRYNESNGAKGAFVVATNLSLGIDQVFCQDQPVWGGMYDLLGEVGILTGAGTANRSLDVDQLGDMPTTCTSDFLITCLNINESDQKYSGSAYGAVSIDLGAPGDKSYTTKIDDRYGFFGDNSAAAPHLTGAIALLYSLPCPALTQNALTQPAQTALSIREAILKGVDTLESLQNLTATGGRLNILRSMETLQNQCAGTSGDLALLKIYPNPASDQLWVEYETPDFESYDLRVFNALGQLVYHDKIAPPRFSLKQKSFNVNNWTPGIYFLTISRGNSYIRTKFVVE